MDFTFVEFPSTVNFNTFQAYFSLSKCKLPKIHGKTWSKSDDTELNANRIKTLRHLALDTLLENWSDNPIFREIERQEDRNYVLSNLNVNLPLKMLSSHIQDDFFWRKSYQHRWKTLYYMLYEYTYQTEPLPPIPPPPLPKILPPQPTISSSQQNSAECKSKAKPWINIYMERHLQEFIENVTTTDYEQESVQALLDICATYINQLEINYLQPSMDGQSGKNNNQYFVDCVTFYHIPLDFILINLPELHTLRLTYCTKTMGTHFYLGCNTLSRRDASLLSRGLQQCHELVNFCLHNTKLEPYQLGLLALSLDKGCNYLTALSLEHCGLGDEGVRQFLSSCNKESFSALKYLDLTNNKISAEGAYILAKVLKSLPLEKLILRLNPITSDGAASIFSVLQVLPVTYLDVACCSLDETITKDYMQLIVQNKSLRLLDVSSNFLGKEFGTHLLKVIGFNKTLKSMDLRNTGISLDMYKQLQNILYLNL